MSRFRPRPQKKPWKKTNEPALNNPRFSDPEPNCTLCPRLVKFRESWRMLEPNWFNAPVPSFGSLNAELLIVGLAPGLRGANSTGRPFTGDYAGNLLYATLDDFGFTHGTYAENGGDSLSLVNCRICNAVRCVPPQNKPVGSEVAACRNFLFEEISAMRNLRCILALGVLAHGATLATMGLKKSWYKFSHGAIHELNHNILLVNSYHCSRYNTNTGRLTEEMFKEIFSKIKKLL